MSNGGRTGGAWRRLCNDLRAVTTHCGMCGGPLDVSLKHPHPMSFSVEHIVPIAHGGGMLDRANVIGAHLHCNTKDGASIRSKVVDEWDW